MFSFCDCVCMSLYELLILFFLDRLLLLLLCKTEINSARSLVNEVLELMKFTFSYNFNIPISMCLNLKQAVRESSQASGRCHIDIHGI